MIPSLEKNDLIYICSPAKAIEEEHLSFAKTFFENAGYRVEISENAAGQVNYFSGSIEDRLSDFQTGLNRKEIKAIVCSRGGYGCVQMLEKLDWTQFKANPKWILGYSDVTNFHMDLARMGMPSIHSTMPLDFQTNSKNAYKSMLAGLEGEHIPLRPIPIT